jgi:hypothetical protein
VERKRKSKEEDVAKFAVQKFAVPLKILVLSVMSSWILVLLCATALTSELILCDTTYRQFVFERNPIGSTVIRVA